MEVWIQLEGEYDEERGVCEEIGGLGGERGGVVGWVDWGYVDEVLVWRDDEVDLVCDDVFVEEVCGVVYGEVLGDFEDDEEDLGGEGEEDGLRCW